MCVRALDIYIYIFIPPLLSVCEWICLFAFFKVENITEIKLRTSLKMMMDRESLSEWAKDKPLSILQLDPADRAVLRIAGKRNYMFSLWVLCVWWTFFSSRLHHLQISFQLAQSVYVYSTSYRLWSRTKQNKEPKKLNKKKTLHPSWRMTLWVYVQF